MVEQEEAETRSRSLLEDAKNRICLWRKCLRTISAHCLGAEVDRTRPGVFQNGPCLYNSDGLLSFHGLLLDSWILDIRTLVRIADTPQALLDVLLAFCLD